MLIFINAAINTGVKCFVFTSSIAVYGTSPELPMTEETRPHPEDSYGIAKLAVEQELVACNNMFGLDYIIFRPHNVYGERQNIGDKYRNVVGIFMNQILQGKSMTVFGDGTQTRAFSYIGDVRPLSLNWSMFQQHTIKCSTLEPISRIVLMNSQPAQRNRWVLCRISCICQHEMKSLTHILLTKRCGRSSEIGSLFPSMTDWVAWRNG